MFADQLKAANEKNVDAYAATLLDFPDMEKMKESLNDFFKTTTMTITVVKAAWTVFRF